MGKKSEFSIKFKTTDADGIIFYVANDRHTDYIALFMRDGRLVYAFNCGSGAVFAESETPFNDGLWHNATFSRVGNRGSLKVDQVCKKILSDTKGEFHLLY